MAFFNTGMIGPAKLQPEIDYDTETVEGRVGNLLNTNSTGRFVNPVVRQAVERQDQAFNARGLRNSSMAIQGGTEAAISKAIEIASPDAGRYFDNRRSNLGIEADFAAREQAQGFDLERQQRAHDFDMRKQSNSQEFDLAKQRDSQQFDLAKQQQTQQFDLGKQRDTQAFQTRQDYQRAVQTIGTNFQRQIDTINSSNMTPEDKNVAIAQAQAMRDGEIAFQNTLFARMPQWQSEWLAAAVPTGGMDLRAVTNRDTLSTIASDPGQPKEMRDAAYAQLQAMPAAPAAPSSMVGPGAAAVTPAGTVLPTATPEAGAIEWTAPTPALGGQTPAQAYAEYEQTVPANAKMAPEDWYRWNFVGGSTAIDAP